MSIEKTKKVSFANDERYIWIDGKQYIRLDRFIELKTNTANELEIIYERNAELYEENQALKTLLKIKE